MYLACIAIILRTKKATSLDGQPDGSQHGKIFGVENSQVHQRRVGYECEHLDTTITSTESARPSRLLVDANFAKPLATLANPSIEILVYIWPRQLTEGPSQWA